MLTDNKIEQVISSIEREYRCESMVFIRIDCYASLCSLKIHIHSVYSSINTIAGIIEKYFQKGGVGGTLCVTKKDCYIVNKIDSEILDEYNIKIIDIPSTNSQTKKTQINIFTR